MGTLTNEIAFFEDTTQYPLSDFLNGYTNFINIEYIDLIGYYKGLIIETPIDIFSKLNNLLTEYYKLSDIIQISKNSFETVAYWDLLDMIDNIGIELKTLEKLSKWLRSSITDSKYTGNVEVQEVLRQNESLENLTDRMGYTDQQEIWLDIARRNDLREEDYDKQGGNILMLVVKKLTESIFLESVVDNISGEKVYGLDLPVKLTFDSDEEDITVLNYKETVLQAAKILINLKRGDVPEFPTDGLQVDLIVGNSIGSIAYPIIFRQLYSIFDKDDTFKQLGIENILQQNDGISMDLLIRTKLNETITENINLS